MNKNEGQNAKYYNMNNINYDETCFENNVKNKKQHAKHKTRASIENKHNSLHKKDNNENENGKSKHNHNEDNMNYHKNDN